MCRALKVLCVAPDRAALSELKRAAVSVDWELTAGATAEDEALAQLEEDRPHVVVVVGPAAGSIVAAIRERRPHMRIVVDRDLPGATVVAASLEEVRGAVKGLPRPGGPVR